MWDQCAHSAARRTAHVAAFLTKEVRDTTDIAGDWGVTHGARAHVATELVPPTEQFICISVHI